jgi:DNA polymerase III subunit beta
VHVQNPKNEEKEKMKLTIDQLQLLKGLQVVERAVSERSALPILSNVLLEAKENALYLTATDLDVGIKCEVLLSEKADSGAVALPAKRLATIIRELPQEKITLEAKSNHTTLISCAQSRFRIPGLPPEDFPVLHSSEKNPIISISQAALKDLISKTAFSMSLEETRYVLNGSLFKVQADSLSLVATDGRRLALASAKLNSSSAQPSNFIVPSKTVRELGRLLETEDSEAVSIEPMKDNQLLFKFGAITVITRLIEGQFPAYEGVIPKDSGYKLSCNKKLFLDAIRRASLMTSQTSQAVVFEISKNKVIVAKESSELGSSTEEIPAEYSGEPMSVAFNPEYWMDALKVLDDETITIELASADKPALVKVPYAGGASSEGQTQFIYIVLPMKLS